MNMIIEDEIKLKVPVELKMPVETYSRVVGYFRPVQQWNIGKKEEFEERVVVELPLDLL